MSSTTITSAGGAPRKRQASKLIRDILDAVELDQPVSRADFAAARSALAAERLPPLDRDYVEKQLAAAEGYVVESLPGYRGYEPGAGRWHIRQAINRLGTTT